MLLGYVLEYLNVKSFLIIIKFQLSTKANEILYCLISSYVLSTITFLFVMFECHTVKNASQKWDRDIGSDRCNKLLM